MYMTPNGKALISYRRVLAVDEITRVVQPLDVQISIAHLGDKSLEA